MKFYFAPLEGVTGYIYRNAYNKHFGMIDKYFAPFIVPSSSKKLKSRELNDVLPEHNEGMTLIPQILTNNAEYFLDTVERLKEFGYKEINFNLGCPSGTVVGKSRGSGFLALRDELDLFLDTVFSKTDAEISIKTRIGKDSADEFYELIKIYNKYPLKELIIHPRTTKDFYNNTPNMEMFKYAMSESTNSLCYNGNIFNVENYNSLKEECPKLEKVMLGRGIIANPALVRELKQDKIVDKTELKAFYEDIYKGYKEILSGDKNVLFKMKEFWYYLSHVFADSEKYAKKIRKCCSLREYDGIVIEIFNNLNIADDLVRGFK